MGRRACDPPRLVSAGAQAWSRLVVRRHAHVRGSRCAGLHDELHVARAGTANASRPNLEVARRAGCAARYPVLDPATPVPWEMATPVAKAAYEKLLTDALRIGQERRVAGALSGVAAAVGLASRPKSKYKSGTACSLVARWRGVLWFH